MIGSDSRERVRSYATIDDANAGIDIDVIQANRNWSSFECRSPVFADGIVGVFEMTSELSMNNGNRAVVEVSHQNDGMTHCEEHDEDTITRDREQSDGP